MTEAEWLACTYPQRMLYDLRDHVSNRKLLLWGVACCRRVWDRLGDQERQNIEVTERYAEGAASEEECRSFTPFGIWDNPEFDRGPDTEDAGQADLFREVFGNPFRPSSPLPPIVLACHDSTVVRLAQAVYEERHLPEGTLDNG